jgi:hypothetical protein
MATKPTHEQAQLHLQVYDLRREPRLRQARDWFQQNYNVQTFDEAMKFMQPDSEGGTNIGMVIGYWEQACALLNYGLLHEGLFFETSSEFYIVWDKLKKVVPEFRAKFGDKHMLENLEKAAERYEEWAERRSPGSIEKMRNMMNQPRPQTSKAANR